MAGPGTLEGDVKGLGVSSLARASWEMRVGIEAAHERCGRVREGGLIRLAAKDMGG